MPVDAENYSITQYDDYSYLSDSLIWGYSKNWHDYFARFQSELLLLKDFLFCGESQLETGHGYVYGYSRKVGIFSKRYESFNIGLGPSPWVGMEDLGDLVFDDFANSIKKGEGLRARVEKEMDGVDELDSAAYEKLMSVIQSKSHAPSPIGNDGPTFG